MLAVLAYLAAGYLVQKPPQVAQPGESYPLVAAPNCRYASGRCDLSNYDFNAYLSVTPQTTNSSALLKLHTNTQVDNVLVSVAYARRDNELPHQMLWDSKQQYWYTNISFMPIADHRLRLVISMQGVNYFVETNMAFAVRELIFDEVKR